MIRVVWIACMLAIGSSAHAQGYSVVGKTFEIRAEEEWRAWIFPEGAVEVLPDGVVRPAFFRKNIDAVLDAQSFTHLVLPVFYDEFAVLSDKSAEELGPDPRVSGGIKDAGTNLEDALNIMDGDLHTYWGPDPSDALKDWWIEVDLGRAVSATRIVLRFVEEGEGDPFLRFSVSVSAGELPYFDAERMGWRQVYRLRDRNYDGRVFEIELGPEIPKEMEGEGAVVQYVRIAVTDMRGDQAEVVPKEEYESLPEEFQGTLVYHRRTPFGEEEEREISEEGYGKLPEEERGSIVYYRRESPRLAEVEVWTLGDNLSLGIGKRGGFVQSSGSGQSLGDELVDGTYTTVQTIGNLTYTDPKMSVIVDLGSPFWADAVRLVGGLYRDQWSERNTSRISGYEIEGSDGTRASDGGLLWRTIVSRWELDEKDSRVTRTEDRFVSTAVRFLNLRFPAAFTGGAAAGLDPLWQGDPSEKMIHLSEFQIYGEGYVPDVTLTSPPIESGWTKALGQIQWEGETPPGTAIEIRTRSGRDVELVRRFHDKGGAEITEREWYELPLFLRGSVTTELQSAHWSVWSQPYRSGERVTSPTPSPYIQVQVRLLSDDPYAYPSIQHISVEYLDPLVQEIVGEIVPFQVTRAGKEQVYSCFLRCTYSSRNVGFDGILLCCPYPVDMELVGVRRGTEKEFASGNVVGLSRKDFAVLSTGSDSIWVQFPSVLKPVRHDVFEVRFSTEVFLKGTSFDVFLVNTARGGVRQQVHRGDAVGSEESEEMRVMVPVETRTVGGVTIHPKVFSPNGDGTNDEVEIWFSVFNVDGTRDVYVEILDLGSRIVRRLGDVGSYVSGRHVVRWDGRDEFGKRVLPGIYVVRICVDTDSRLVAEDRTLVRTLHVVY